MKRLIDKLVFALYFIPVIFILMYSDWSGDFKIVAPLSVIFTLAAATHFMWYGYRKYIFFGNIISFVISLILVIIFLPASKVGYFFMPIGPIGALVLFSVLSFVIQYIFAWVTDKMGKWFLR